MISLLLGIIAAEIGLILVIAFGIIGIEFYSMFLRSKAIDAENKLMKIRVSPEELSSMLGGKGLPSVSPVDPKSTPGLSGHYL